MAARPSRTRRRRTSATHRCGNMRHAACTTQDASDSIAVGCADSHARRRGRPTAPRAPRSLRRTPASVPRQSRSKTAAVAQSVLRATAVRTAVTKRCSGAVTAAKTLRSHSAHSGPCLWLRSNGKTGSAVQCSARNNLRKESRIGTVDNCGQPHRLVAIRIVIARVRVMLVFASCRVQQRLVGDAGLHPSAGP
jgi:hypothetical protein